MEKILDKEKWDWDFEFYPPDTFNDGEYVLSKYAILERVEEGFLLFHTITRAMYLLSYDEFVDILNNETLKREHIVNNSNVDEDKIALDTYMHRAQCPMSDYKSLGSYVIFTTNNCNAQCFYCYENDAKKEQVERGMTLKTAEKVVQYIINTRCDEPIKIEWFGGEPLLNVKIIDYITQRLTEENIEFTSGIITNGLLLNKKNIEKAYKQWNVKNIQITVDGVGEVYNNIKNYKAIKFDAFSKVIKNIRDIMETTDIALAIRINICEENINDAEDVLKYFMDDFKTFIEEKRLFLNLHPTYQLDIDDDKIDSPVFAKIEELAETYNIHKKRKNLLNHIPITHCMGDMGKCVVINPKGYLSLCEHWMDENIIGNITDGITNPDVIKEWNDKSGTNIEYCLSEKCPYLPICDHLVKCPSKPHCTSKQRLKKTGEYYRGLMLFVYQNYKNGITATKNGEE